MIHQSNRGIHSVSSVVLWFIAQVVGVSLLGADGDVIRKYDIADLLSHLGDFPAPKLGPGAAPPGIDGRDVLATDREDVDLADSFISLEQFLRERLPGDVVSLVQGQGESHLVKTEWYLTAPLPVQQSVEQAISFARARAQTQVRVESDLVLMNPARRQVQFSLSKFPWLSAGNTPLVSFAEVPSADADLMLQTMRAMKFDPDIQVIRLPDITVYTGQLGHAASVREVWYRPLSIRKEQKLPQSVAVKTGWTLAVRATPTEDNNHVALSVDHRSCNMLEMRTIEAGASETVNEPVVWQGGEYVERTIALGSSLIIATGVYLDEKGAHSGFLVVRTTLLYAGNVPDLAHP